MIKAGILSDTHLATVTATFKELAERAFSDCEVIFHAGDITSSAVLDIFTGKITHAVHGNMCNYATQQLLSSHGVIELGGYRIGLCHGTGTLHNIEERMWTSFTDADCIIYGHTHRPIIEKKGGILFINPGSFLCSSHYGTPASYAILDIGETGLNATLHSISLAP